MYRVLIADDEKGIREGLKRFIEKNFPDFQVIAAVEDGQKALEYSKALIPDVILTDINMPRMNGLEYLEIIKESLPETVLLVVSGYETFDYVLQCIHLGVREYFLKPVDTNRLKQVMCQLRPELERLQKRWQIRSEPWDGGKTGRILEEILTGGSQQVQVPARTYYPVCAYGNIQHELLYEKLRARFYGEAEVYPAAEREQECVLVLAFPPRFPAAFAAGVMRGLMAVHNYFMSTGGWDIRFLMGQPGDTGEKLHASWEELEQLKDTIFRDAAEPVLSCNDVLQRRENSFTQPPAWIYKEIRHAARNGSPEDIQKHCESIKTWLLSLEIVDVVFAKNAVEAVCSQLFFGSEAFFTEEMYGLFLDTKERIWQQTSFYGLMGVLEAFAETASQARRSEKKEEALLERIGSMIEERLDDPQLSFESIAGELYFTPNYLRALFKKETGMTFVEYLTEKRMERARELLKNSERKIGAVAALVGYKDSKYFSNTFKKASGMSPTEYQNLYGKGEGKE